VLQQTERSQFEESGSNSDGAAKLTPTQERGVISFCHLKQLTPQEFNRG